MGYFDCDLDKVLENLDSLAQQVPEAIPEALDAMADILVTELKKAAPEQETRAKRDQGTKALKESIGKTGTRTGKGGVKYKNVFVKDRGENDRNVYKAIINEWGRRKVVNNDGKTVVSYVRPRPFWRNTMNESKEQMKSAGEEVIKGAIKKAIK